MKRPPAAGEANNGLKMAQRRQASARTPGRPGAESSARRMQETVDERQRDDAFSCDARRGSHEPSRQASPVHPRRASRLSRRGLPAGLVARRLRHRGGRADERDGAARLSSGPPQARRHDLGPGDVRALRPRALCRDPARNRSGEARGHHQRHDQFPAQARAEGSDRQGEADEARQAARGRRGGVVLRGRGRDGRACDRAPIRSRRRGTEPGHR